MLLLGKIHEDRWTKLQGFGQTDNIFQSNISLPTLDAAEVTARQTTLQGKLFL